MASNSIRPQILLLKEGTDTSQGLPQIVANINACQMIGDIVKTTLGPRGMDKLIVDDNSGSVCITNDGATVMTKLNIKHPAAKLLVDISKSQDNESGDGTTSVVVIAVELLRKAKDLLEDKIAPRSIIHGLRKANYLALEKLKVLAIKISNDKPNLISLAETALNSKLVNAHKSYFANLITRAVEMTSDHLGVNMIGIKKVSGGSLDESFLVEGVAFKKTFSYAGFEQQPKKFVNAKILLLNLELELKAEKDNAEIKITDPSKYQAMVDAEWGIIYEKLENIVKTGANVVLSRLPIGDLATQYFADRNIFCAGRVEESDLLRTKFGTGAEVQTTVNGITKDCLGECGLFEEIQLGSERFNIFKDCPKAKSCTLILRGGALQYLDEAERSIHDAIMIVKRAKENTSIVPGGGAIELELSRYIKEVALTLQGSDQLVLNAYAKALQVIPRTLIANSGGDSIKVLNDLIFVHNNDPEKRWFGVDCINCGMQDTYKNFVWEPLSMKYNALSSACEAACVVLSIDETIKNPSSENKNMKGGKGKGKGRF